MRIGKRVGTGFVLAALVGLAGCSGNAGTNDAGGERDAGVDGGSMPRDAGRHDASRDPDAGRPPTDGAGPVPTGTYVQGGIGTLGGSPAGGPYRVVEDEIAGGGMSCAGARCVHGSVTAGRGLMGAGP